MYRTDIEIYKVKNTYAEQPISISGPSAVGKSSVGELLAKEMGLLFFDLDEQVCKDSGFNTTQEVIRYLGHKEFKIIQQRSLQSIVEDNKTKYVLACGGEIIRPGYDQQVIDSNRKLIKTYTYNICLFPSQDLDESVNILFPRLHDGKRDTKTTGETLSKFRSYIDVFPQYSDLADVILFTHNSSLTSVVEIITNILKQKY